MTTDPARQLFNRRAAHWDNTARQDDHIIATMLTLSSPVPHGIFLDVGCGTGVLEPWLLACRPAAILAVDYAENMIREAKQKLRHDAVKFVCADILDVSDLQADNCFVFNTFPHFPDPDQVLEHLATLLKPGGRITVAHPQGRKDDAEHRQPPSFLAPAQGLTRLMEPFYHVDTIIDSNIMFLVSGLKR